MSTTLDDVPSTSGQKILAKANSTQVMVDGALKALDSRSGTSLVAIKKFLAATYDLDIQKPTKITLIKKYIKNSIASGKVIQIKGIGINGSFKLSAAAQKASKPKPAKKAVKAKKGDSGEMVKKGKGEGEAPSKKKPAAKKEATEKEATKSGQEKKGKKKKEDPVKEGPPAKKAVGKLSAQAEKPKINLKLSAQEQPTKGAAKKSPATVAPIKAAATKGAASKAAAKKTPNSVKKTPPKKTPSKKGAKKEIKMPPQEDTENSGKSEEEEIEAPDEMVAPEEADSEKAEEDEGDSQEESQAEDGEEEEVDPDEGEESSEESAKTAVATKGGKKAAVKAKVKRKSIATLARGSRPGKFAAKR